MRGLISYYDSPSHGIPVRKRSNAHHPRAILAQPQRYTDKNIYIISLAVFFCSCLRLIHAVCNYPISDIIFTSKPSTDIYSCNDNFLPSLLQ